jgi:hypothetical protein
MSFFVRITHFPSLRLFLAAIPAGIGTDLHLAIHTFAALHPQKHLD